MLLIRTNCYDDIPKVSLESIEFIRQSILRPQPMDPGPPTEDENQAQGTAKPL